MRNWLIQWAWTYFVVSCSRSYPSINFSDSLNQDEILDEKIIIADLKKMIKVALDNGEMDLVYKIERTIDSIDDKEVVCE